MQNESSPDRASPSDSPLRHPVVLIHGLGARANYGPVSYFYGIPARLRDSGIEVFTPKLPAWKSIAARAEELGRQIENRFGREGRVNLIGHSLGGIDARYLVSRLGFADRVASITTLGTPNRGSSLCDLRLPRSLARRSAVESLLRFMGLSREIFSQLGRESCAALNREIPDAKGITYFSATSRIGESLTRQSLPIFWITHSLLRSLEGENDGFVSVDSARWGDHLCTVEGDHYGQIGQLLGHSRGLDHYALFDRIMSELRAAGF